MSNASKSKQKFVPTQDNLTSIKTLYKWWKMKRGGPKLLWLPTSCSFQWGYHVVTQHYGSYDHWRIIGRKTDTDSIFMSPNLSWFVIDRHDWCDWSFRSHRRGHWCRYCLRWSWGWFWKFGNCLLGWFQVWFWLWMAFLMTWWTFPGKFYVGFIKSDHLTIVFLGHSSTLKLRSVINVKR